MKKIEVGVIYMMAQTNDSPIFAFKLWYTFCRNPTLAKCGGEAQHLEKLEVWSPSGLPNV